MKKFIKFLCLIFFFFNFFAANAALSDISFEECIENNIQKIEYISNSKNQTEIEISKKQDLFFIKNEENTEISSLNTHRNSFGGFLKARITTNINLNNFYFNKDILAFRMIDSISPILEHSIATRAP